MNGQTSFYTYLVYLIIGLALIVLIPEKYRTSVVAILILGGFASIGKKWPDLVSQLQGQSGDTSTGTILPMPVPSPGSGNNGSVVLRPI